MYTLFFLVNIVLEITDCNRGQEKQILG
jgi:hypothetical protein